MTDNGQYPYFGGENKMQVFQNGYQSALNYVQQAIENGGKETQDATQNLVNNVLKKRNGPM